MATKRITFTIQLITSCCSFSRSFCSSPLMYIHIHNRLHLGLLCVWTVYNCEGYSQRAGSCSGPRSGHGPPLEGSGGFILEPLIEPGTRVSNNQTVKFELRGSADQRFRGFLIQITNGRGTFGDMSEGTGYKVCYGREDFTTLEHTNALQRHSVNFT